MRSGAVGAVFEFLEVLSAQLFVLVYLYFYDGGWWEKVMVKCTWSLIIICYVNFPLSAGLYWLILLVG